MNVSESILGLTASYVAVTMLLISLNMTSLWRWWIKAASIVVTTIFFGVTAQAINGLMGWPTTQPAPYRFNLISSRITEPDRRIHAPGFIYLWTEELNHDNVPFGRPRSYQIPYTELLARKVSDAQEKRNQGVEIMGRIGGDPSQEKKEPTSTLQGGAMHDDRGQTTLATDTVRFKEDGSDLSFEDLPPILLPDKDSQ